MEFGKITDEAIAALKERIGVERKKSNMHPPGALQLTRETIRRYAIGTGDDNPLYHDPGYAKASRYQSIICSPSILSHTEKANGGSEGFPGCHAIWRTVGFEWYLPFLMDDALESGSFLRRVEEVPSKFSGRAAVQEFDTLVRNQRGELVGKVQTTWHRFAREDSKREGKYEKRGTAHYKPEDIEKIKADYKKEKRRGAETLWWEDVRQGEEIPFIVKGPTTQISKFAYESWTGGGNWFVGHRLAFELFERHPGLPFINEQGCPEAPVAIHWSNERCQAILGLPGAYDAGYERIGWLAHLFMNWIGDEGFLHRMFLRFGGFNILGDTHWLHARVTDKFLLDQPVDGKRHAVRLDLWTANQNGETTTTGEAVVLLRSRQ